MVKQNRKATKVSLPQLIRTHPFEPPILPEKMIWTASSVKLFRRCKRKFFWKYIMRVVPKYRPRPLVIGAAFHDALAEWYAYRRKPMTKIAMRYQGEAAAAMTESLEFFNEEEREKFEAEVRVLSGMLMGYADIYQHEKDEWLIKRKHIEQKFAVDMGDFIFQGKIDLFAGWRNKRRGDFLVEHKTAAKIDANYIDRLPLDTQVRGYILGATRGLGLKPREVAYDIVKKCKLRKKSGESVEDFSHRVQIDYASRPDFYFHREYLIFSKSDIAAFEYELRQVHAEFVDLQRQGAWDDPRNWMPNDGACWDFFKQCEYHPLCTVGLDTGTAIRYLQNEELHSELAEDD